MTPSTPPRNARSTADGGVGPAVGTPASRPKWGDLDEANTAAAHVFAGPFVWGGIGWLADGWLGTGPWLFAVGIMAGFGAGLYLVWIRSTAMRAATAGDETHKAIQERDVSATIDGDLPVTGASSPRLSENDQ